MTNPTETHAEKASALQLLEEAYKQQGTLTPNAIEYLLEQARWSLSLDNAATNFLNSTDRYVTSLQRDITARDETIQELTDNNADLLSILTELKPEEA